MTRQYKLDDDSVVVVVVIGSGAGGGTVANELAQQGVGVGCLETGNRLTLADVVNDSAVMDQKMGGHDKGLGAPLWICKTLGGTTMRWSGVTPTPRPPAMTEILFPIADLVRGKSTLNGLSPLRLAGGIDLRGVRRQLPRHSHFGSGTGIGASARMVNAFDPAGST